MLLKPWEELPPCLRRPEVRPYYERLSSRRFTLFIKRAMDIFLSLLLLFLLSPLFLILSVWIKADSPGPVFFRQERVTQYGRVFRIFKFRTMVSDAERLGSSVTVRGDRRITRVGAKIRRSRLDEIPQLLNVLVGDMSFVGTRPEVPRYVACYSSEMMATLLLPAGITSPASIRFREEDKLLQNAADADEVYIHEILPVKMAANLQYLRRLSILRDIAVLFYTVFPPLGKEGADKKSDEQTKA